ncbi:FAD-dependent monooxygenase [Actinomadura sp. 1N219]|uniref:FAD-dependent monooxygenase n=1 Tax=Actinomadura sp. 1N219 TaxID=3375152 RepID=UPI0037B5F5A6
MGRGVCRPFCGRSVMSVSPGAVGDSDVVVVGAGPTGLLLAGDLALAGLSVRLVERRRAEISNLSRALVVHARTLEQFDARGIADELVAGGHPVSSLQLFQRVRLDPSRLPTRFPFVLFTPQYEVERVLERRAREAGVAFVYDTRVVSVEQDESGVCAHVAPGEGADSRGPSFYRGSFLVGADGVHSSVREALGLPFPGTTLLSSLILADVRLARAPERAFTVNAVSDGFCLLTEMGQGWHRITGWSRRHQLPDDAPLDLAEVKELLQANFGTDYGLSECRWKSRFHSDERQSPSYRVGRVFLAGDAAHVHSPAGAMGMNTGLQDAANLSWKLVAVIRDGADERLLDSYERERHAVGKVVLRMSGMLVRVGVLHAGPARLARSVLGAVLTRLRPATDKAASMISGIGLAYRAERGSHRLAGKRAPDLELAEGRLYELLRGGEFVLITPDRGPSDTPEPAIATSVTRARWSHDRPTINDRRTGIDRRTTVLVRPDGYIAWAAGNPGTRALRAALTAWTGKNK